MEVTNAMKNYEGKGIVNKEVVIFYRVVWEGLAAELLSDQRFEWQREWTVHTSVLYKGKRKLECPEGQGTVKEAVWL